MSESMDEVIPKGVGISKCVGCRKIVTAYDAYFDYPDYYDGFDENDDPDDGYLTQYMDFRCPYCGESNSAEMFHGRKGYRIEKDEPPPSRFNLGGKFQLQQASSGFSLPGKFSLFNLRRRKAR